MRAHSRLAMTVAALTLSVSTLSGCGGNSTDAYCKSLKEDKAYFADLGKGDDFSKFDDALKRFHELADQAPDEVADDWKVVDGTFKAVEKALKDAGVSFADLVKAQSGQLPKGVDAQKLQAVLPKLQALSSAKFAKASKNIEKHAKSECNVNLS
jgi:hypothetical protein